MTDKKSTPKQPGAGDLELESIRIEPAANGYTMTVRKKIKRELRDSDFAYPDEEQLVFTDARELLQTVGSRLGVKIKLPG